MPSVFVPLASFLTTVAGCLTSSALAAPEVKVSEPNPHHDLLSLIQMHCNDPTFSDVAFVFDGGRAAASGEEGAAGSSSDNFSSAAVLEPSTTAYAHKLILALSSPTFAVMFASTFAESAASGRSVIQMDPELFSCDAFKLVLTYLYTGHLPTAGREDATADEAGGRSGHSCKSGSSGKSGKSGSSGKSGAGKSRDGGREEESRSVEPLRPTDEGVSRLLEVLQAADYLELAHLKQLGERLCIDWEILQVENCVHVYQHACGVRCEQLRLSCVQFIRGLFDVVKETEAFQALPEALQREVQEIRWSKPEGGHKKKR